MPGVADANAGRVTGSRRPPPAPTLAGLDAEVAGFAPRPDGQAAAAHLLALAERVLEQWAAARGEEPTREEREGFRLLALHRQGARGDPSFNACRETCREIAYHYNLLRLEPRHAEAAKRQAMMAMLVRHLALFVSGKFEVEGLGEFCCSSRPLRTASADDTPPTAA